MGPCQSKTASWALGSAWRRGHQGASGQGDVEGEGGAASVAAEQERSAEESRNARLTTLGQVVTHLTEKATRRSCKFAHDLTIPAPFRIGGLL